jgi:stage V sporulation protein D (sporulation-specific penicillin-binding protein)
VIEEADRRKTARVLAAQLGQDQSHILAQLSRPLSHVVLLKDVGPQDARAVAGLSLPGIMVERGYARLYPLAEVCGPLVGFREKSISLTGLSGLEATLDPILIGGSDSRCAAIWPLAPVGLTSGSPRGTREPHNVVLTLDARIQAAAFRILSEHMQMWRAKAASCTIMDPATGEILCMVSLPAFDPNSFEKVPVSEWHEFQCIPASLAFEPGSMCKPLILAAALESGAVAPQQRFVCTGTRRLGGWTIGCWGQYRRTGHGTVTPITGLVRSCNMAYAQISTAVGPSQLHGWLQEFGLGRSTGSECYAEASGHLPPISSIGAVKLATMGYGQSLTVTGLQVVAAFGAIANDGALVRPHIVSAITTADGEVLERVEPQVVRQAISPRTAHMVLDAMEDVVAGSAGTGRAARIAGCRVCGKTGTAQKVGQGEEGGGYLEKRYISSFVGVAGVATKRPIVILVWFDEPAGGATGGRVAAPAFKQVAEAALRHLGVLPAARPTQGRRAAA